MGLFDAIQRWTLDTGFDLKDKNNDGFLTKAELGKGSFSSSESVNGQVTKQTILNAETFDSFDTDKNGVLDKKEVHKGFGVGEWLSAARSLPLLSVALLS